jgi:hypothetical protein
MLLACSLPTVWTALEAGYQMYVRYIVYYCRTRRYRAHALTHTFLCYLLLIQANLIAPSNNKPIIASECGYHTYNQPGWAGVSQLAQAKYPKKIIDTSVTFVFVIIFFAFI